MDASSKFKDDYPEWARKYKINAQSKFLIGKTQAKIAQEKNKIGKAQTQSAQLFSKI